MKRIVTVFTAAVLLAACTQQGQQAVTTSAPPPPRPKPGVAIVAPVKPPPPKTETIPPKPPAPEGHFVWNPGHYHWGYTDDPNNGSFSWMPGGWVEQPYPTSIWTNGSWTLKDDNWGWTPGYWQ
ncbi:MAG: membrane lipoprotein lipid attachment site-containing protein [Proteobacteria bacterium]|nr:membrane lipoprotein lipid attachment site-containing protein [Pseudomonadota bacterium]